MMIRTFFLLRRSRDLAPLWAALFLAVSLSAAVAQTLVQPGQTTRPLVPPAGPTPVQTQTQPGPTPTLVTPPGPTPTQIVAGPVSTPASALYGLCQCLSDINNLDFTCPGSAAACQSNCGGNYSYVPDAQCRAAGQ
jgi:hypothetical protein